jgi:hypothetical protein
MVSSISPAKCTGDSRCKRKAQSAALTAVLVGASEASPRFYLLPSDLVWNRSHSYTGSPVDLTRLISHRLQILRHSLPRHTPVSAGDNPGIALPPKRRASGPVVHIADRTCTSEACRSVHFLFTFALRSLRGPKRAGTRCLVVYKSPRALSRAEQHRSHQLNEHPSYL